MIPSPVSLTYRSLGIEIIVVAPSFGLNEATIMESARYDHACPSPPYPTIITFIFPFSSVCIGAPKLLDIIFTVPLDI